MSWHDYNESLVERGRVLFDLGFAKGWNEELKDMNKEKRGRPYVFPDSYIDRIPFLLQGWSERTVQGDRGG